MVEINTFYGTIVLCGILFSFTAVMLYLIKHLDD